MSQFRDSQNNLNLEGFIVDMGPKYFPCPMISKSIPYSLSYSPIFESLAGETSKTMSI